MKINEAFRIGNPGQPFGSDVVRSVPSRPSTDARPARPEPTRPEPHEHDYRHLYNRVINSDLSRDKKEQLINRIKNAASPDQGSAGNDGGRATRREDSEVAIPERGKLIVEA